MVDYRNAWSAEEKVIELIRGSRKLKKYKLELHRDDKFGVDIESRATGYEDFAIEIESTQGSKWPSSAPYPTTWRKFSVPARKKKFFERHPMSLFVKVNRDLTRAVVIPMSYVFAADVEGYRNQTDNHFDCNEFYVIYNSEHPALCFCSIDQLPDVIDEHFKHMTQMKRVNVKYTDMRPEFGAKKKE